ncbi:MAG TPA: FtsX-like permease family protein [Steroidobacteraceae bacterium]|nr:FtsX-like permease family protein [Steroidobacteraceae bacterium]
MAAAFMEILPILKALRRNKVGAMLIGLQIAFTLAIVCNCLSMIQQYRDDAGRPSGIDEADIFTFSNQWVGKPPDLPARTNADLALIRSVPGVVDAQVTNSFPLRGGGMGWGLSVKPEQRIPTSPTTIYFVDDHGLATYGLKLAAGRWFTASEIGEHGMHDMTFPASVIVSDYLARKLYPSRNALGQVVYWAPTAASRIVGIVERAQTPWAAYGHTEDEQSTFMPYHFVNSGVYYVVRARPGQLNAVMTAVQTRLYALSRQRVIDQVQSFAETRNLAYFRPRSTAVLLGGLCLLLLAITLFGTIGLTMYWVGQRRRQIGMRRALGARRLDVLRYFHTENLLIAGSGALLGIALGLGANLWLVSHLELPRMSIAFVLAAAAVVLAVSQVAVFWPALRAASVSPAAAISAL